MQSLIATKIGVVAATIDKAHPVLITNYNSLPETREYRQSSPKRMKSGSLFGVDYKCINQKTHGQIEVWQA